jgi:hypothetical protein
MGALPFTLQPVDSATIAAFWIIRSKAGFATPQLDAASPQIAK